MIVQGNRARKMLSVFECNIVFSVTYKSADALKVFTCSHYTFQPKSLAVCVQQTVMSGTKIQC